MQKSKSKLTELKLVVQKISGKPGRVKSIEDILPKPPSGKPGRIKSFEELLPKTKKREYRQDTDRPSV